MGNASGSRRRRNKFSLLRERCRSDTIREPEPAQPKKGPFVEGDVVGNYQVCDKLGQGMGGGVVYCVRWRGAAGGSPTSRASPPDEDSAASAGLAGAFCDAGNAIRSAKTASPPKHHLDDVQQQQPLRGLLGPQDGVRRGRAAASGAGAPRSLSEGPPAAPAAPAAPGAGEGAKVASSSAAARATSQGAATRGGAGGGGGAALLTDVDVAASDDNQEDEPAFMALKYPVNREEEEFCKALRGQRCLGVPRIFELGEHLQECYVVVQLLGAPVSRLFELLSAWDVADKWQILRVLGRQLVRRLRAVHRLGFVHCDVNASNIMLGGCEEWCPMTCGAGAGAGQFGGLEPAAAPGGLTGAEGREAAAATAQSAEGAPAEECSDAGVERAASEVSIGCEPFLIDFGCSRRFPNGDPMQPYWGSIDFTSINALTATCSRGPWDDLESLGWLLLHGLFPELPWSQWTRAAWSVNGMGESRIALACQQVRLAKVALLELGCGAFEPHWAHLGELPGDLRRFLRHCRKQACGGGGAAAFPDHGHLLEILGGTHEQDEAEAERGDVRFYREFGRQAAAPCAEREGGRLREPWAWFAAGCVERTGASTPTRVRERQS